MVGGGQEKPAPGQQLTRPEGWRRGGYAWSPAALKKTVSPLSDGPQRAQNRPRPASDIFRLQVKQEGGRATEPRQRRLPR